MLEGGDCVFERSGKPMLPDRGGGWKGEPPLERSFGPGGGRELAGATA